MYLKEEFWMGNKDSLNKVVKAIKDLIEKNRAEKNLKITLIIEEEEFTHFYDNAGGTTSDSKFW